MAAGAALAVEIKGAQLGHLRVSLVILDGCQAWRVGALAATLRYCVDLRVAAVLTVLEVHLRQFNRSVPFESR